MAQGLQRLGSQAHPHQAVHPQNQRQGRAVHQNPVAEWAYAMAFQTSEKTEALAAPLSEAL